MTNAKNTKRALLTSVLALVLCFTMLLGSTFAWFTDSAASGSNVIKSGNLDIVVEYTLDGENWDDLDGANDLFQKGLWEPGHTEVVLLRVTNKGSLALKYSANMNIVKETVGKTSDGKNIVLSDLLIVSTCTQQYTDGNGNVASGADIFPAMTFNGDGGVDGWIGYTTSAAFKEANVLKNGKQLLPKEADYIAVKVDMDETIGNEANHDGTNVPEIEFGINVFATQYTKESDSFGNQYDDLAGETHFMMNGKNYFSFDDAVANATPDANGVVEYFIGGEAVFSGGWDAPIAPAGAKKVVIKGTGANTSTLNLAHTYRNQLCATGMIVEISDITIECDPCGTHQDERNIWVHADELYATNVVFKDPADASKVKVAVFDGCTFASATADEEPSGGNYQLWVGDHDANHGATTESVTVKNCVFESGRRAIKLAPTTGSTSYVALIEGNTFNNITYKPAVCLNYGAQANTVTITNNKFINTVMVEDEVNRNYTESDNKVIVTVNNTDALNTAVKSGAAEVEVPAGTYTFPSSQLSAGQTLICAPGTVFEGNSKLNIKGATVVGATFSNPTGTTVDQTINGTFKDCVFDGSNALRWCYAGEKVVFENCVFTGDLYGVHFDGGANTVEFKNCTFSGFNATAAAITKITFEGCTFVGNGRSIYNGINLWGNGDFKDCTFVFDGSSTYEWIDLCAADKIATFNNCVVSDGTTTSNVSTLIGDKLTKRQASSKIIVDGVELTY